MLSFPLYGMDSADKINPIAIPQWGLKIACLVGLRSIPGSILLENPKISFFFFGDGSTIKQIRKRQQSAKSESCVSPRLQNEGFVVGGCSISRCRVFSSGISQFSE